MPRTIAFIAGILFAASLMHPSAAASGYKFLKLDGVQVKWPAHSQGATITYAVSWQSPSLHGVENCQNTAGVDRLLTRSQLSRGSFSSALDRAFRLWSQAADVHFVQAEPGAAADITLTAEDEPDGVGFTDVTHTSSTITRALICLNPELAWTADNASARDYRLYYVLAHEIGHAIGLDHPSPEGELMSFEYSRTLQSLQRGDIAGVTALYGIARRRTAEAMHR